VTQIQKPYDVTFSPNLSGLTIAGRNASATRITVTNNDSRDIPEVRINVLRADLMPSNTMFEAAIVKDGAGEKVVTEKWVQAKMSTDVAYTPIDDWSSPIAFTLASSETKAFDIKLVIPDTITVQGKISFSLLVSFLANTEPKITSISIDGTPLPNIVATNNTTLTATIVADAGANTAITWTSSNKDVFTVNSSGVVTAVDVGKAIVTAISSNPTIFNGVFLTVLPMPPIPSEFIAWYDASDTSSIIATGNNVTQWNDKSTNNYHAVNHLTNPTTNVQTLNGLNVMQFNGDWLDMPLATIPAGVAQYTIAAVWKVSSGARRTIVSFGVETPGGGGTYYKQIWAHTQEPAGANVGHRWIGDDLNSPDGSIDYATANTSILSWDGTTRKSILNGLTYFDTPTNTKNTASDAARIGATTSSNGNYNINGGYIAELIIYHKVLTASELADLQTYLNTKWGLTPSANTPVTTGMVAWYDANDASTIHDGGGTGVLYQWDDKSGNAYNATQHTLLPTTGFVTLNSKNVIRFNGDYMLLPVPVIPDGTKSYTICAVWKPAGTNEALVHFGSTGITNQSVGIHSIGTGVRQYWWNHDLDVVTSYDANSITCSWDGTTRTTIIDGVSYTDTPTGKSTATALSALGGIPNNGYMLTGYIAEFIIYHRALTPTEILENETYFNNKWGV